MSGVLRLLHTTGASDGDTKFRAAHFHDPLDMTVDLHIRGNEWAKCLCDGEKTAAYVFLNEICLECRAPNYPTSTCGGSLGYTVLQTQLKVQEQRDLSLVRLLPQNIVLERANKGVQQLEDMLMVITSPVKRLLSHLSNPEVAGYEVSDGLSQPEETVAVCVQASTKLFGGMKSCRDRKDQHNESITSPRSASITST